MTITAAAPASDRAVDVAPPRIRRLERFASVGSTNDVVREWLAAGEAEICLAVADEQTAGRGRSGRTWTAPSGAGILLSAGFRPAWLPVERVWRLAATVSLAMAGAAEDVVGLPAGSLGLKWPNDLAILADGDIRKLGGVLGETDGLGTEDPRVVVGIGLNADWPADRFPAELAPTMTSLHEVGGRRPVDRDLLLAAFTSRLETGMAALHGGRFDGAAWADRQLTTGRSLELIAPDGSIETVHGRGVDAATGALIVEAGAIERSVLVGEIRHVRLAGV